MHFEAIAPQVDAIILIDNGSGDETIAMLNELKEAYSEKLHLILLTENRGLGAAQNIGISEALARSYDWIMLLDDDSEASPDMVEAMASCYQALPHRESVALLAPRLWDEHARQEMPYIIASGKYGFKRRLFGESPTLEVLNAIASGSMIKRSVFEKERLLREDFFIDYIDTEWCLRLVSHGWRIIAVRAATLYHRLGKKENHPLLTFTVTTSNHTAARRYTIYRNRVRVWRQYMCRVPGYILYDMLAVGYDLLRVVCFEKDKGQKLAQMVKGAWAGVRMRDRW